MSGHIFDPGDGTALALRIINRDGTAVSAGGGGGTSSTDDAAFTVAASSGTPVGGIFTSDSVDAGDFGVFAILANRQQKVSLYDSAGAEITSFGGGTEYTEDAASAADPKGGMLMLRRRDVLSATEVSTESDNIAANATSKGELYVKHSDAIAVTGPLTDTQLRASAVPVSLASAPTTAVTLAAGASAIAKAEDVGSADGDVGVPAMARRTATPANTSGTDLDYEMLQMANGRLWASATIDAALPAGTNAIGKLATNAGVTIGAVEIAAAQTLATVTTVSTVTSLTQMNGAAIAMNTGTRSAGTQRVTIATDDSVPVTGTFWQATQPVSGTVSVNTHDVGAITTSVTPGTSAAHLGKAEDAAHGSGDTGVMALAVRRDADTTLVDTTGDYAPLQVNAAGSLKVAITAGAGSGGTSLADNAGFTPGSTSFTPIGGEVDDTGTSAASENSAAAARITPQRAIHVNLRDNSGAELSVGGGTQYDEDAVSAGAEKVTMAGVVRRDTAASSSGTDGDISTLATDATGRLWAHVGTIDGGTVTTVSTVTNLSQLGGTAIAMGTGARAAGVQRVTIATDDVVAEKADVVTAQTAAWTSATAQDTAITLTVTGYATVAMTINPTTTFSAGVLTFELSDDAGTTWYPVAATRMDSYASELTYTIVASTKRVWQIDVAGFTSYRVRLSTAITGSGTANLRIQATAASSEGSVTVGQSTAASLQATASQGGTWTVQPGNTANTTAWKVDASSVAVPITDNSGSLTVDAPVGTPAFVRLSDGAAAITTLAVSLASVPSHAVTNAGTFAVQSADAGDVAHDGVDSGNPVKMGAQARSSEPSAVSTNADRVNLIADMVGKLIVLPYANPENFVSGAITSAMAATTTTSLVAAPAAGLRNYITQITVSNGSTTVPTDILIQDGSGGTTLYVLPAPIGTGTGTGTSGGTYVFPTPLRQPTAATALFCANVTTGSSTKVSASGYKGA